MTHAESTGRGITTLSLRSFRASPVPVIQTFNALSTLRLDLHYVSWSDLQKIGNLVHLQHLHLSEVYRYRHAAAEPQDRAFAWKTPGHDSPFSGLMGLRSLKLELFESSSADPDCDGTRCFLQPISCMNNLQGFTLLGLTTNIGIHHLSQLSQLTSLGIDYVHVEDGLSTLVNLKHLQAAATSLRPPNLPWRPTANLFASLVALTNLRSLDCTLVPYCQVLKLSVLTGLSALTIGLMNDILFDHQSCMAVWSDLAESKHLKSLSVHDDAFLDAKDFQAIAVLSCLTKLHFEGFTSDLHFKPEDVNKLSALASLQYLNLEFIHSGRWCDALDELDDHLNTLMKVANMQVFQVVSSELQSENGDKADHHYAGGLHLQPGEEDSSLGSWNSDSDRSSDTDSDMYSLHSHE